MNIGIISPNTKTMGIANTMYNNFILKLTILADRAQELTPLKLL